jgi:Mn-dependent DtxR family transcriptional regulator
MVEWPKHSQTIRDDELLLFAYCRHRWGDAAYADRSELQYEDVATRLNDQFRHRVGEYTACAIRRYLQKVRSDPHYRWSATGHKRSNEFATEIDRSRVERARTSALASRFI